MTDFGSVIYKVKPGLKAYMFVSTYSNVIDELMSRSLKSDYVNRLYHPFSKHDLELYLGFGESTQAIIIHIDDLSDKEWSLIDDLLSKPKTKGLSVYLIGSSLFGGNDVRNRVAKQGIYVEATNPHTPLTQKNLSVWFGDECKVHVSDAYKVCQTLEWDLSSVLWTIKSYQRVTSNNVLPRPTAQKLLDMCAFRDVVSSSYSLIISKKIEALKSVKGFTEDQNQELVTRLSDFLSGISVLSDYVKDNLSDKQISAQSGLNIVDVIALKPYVSRYPMTSIIKLSKLLKFAQANIEHPELAETVALLWTH